MTAKRLLERTGWLFAGAAAILLVAACSGVIDAPNQTSSTGAESSDEDTVLVTGSRVDGRTGSQRARAEFERRLEDEREREQRAQAAGQQSRDETVIVTGSRIPSRSYDVPTAAPVPPGGFAGFAPMLSVAPVAAQGGALSGVTPGEEVWIIAQPAPTEALLAAADEDALGSGVMLAREMRAI
jgi:hypothetical protein